MTQSKNESSVVSCTVCSSADTRQFLRICDIPVFCNIQWQSEQLALDAPVGNISLTYCHSCGHVFNSEFDPALVEYSGDYENSLHFSPHFQKYAEDLVESLVERYELQKKVIIEIGCGKGEFISMLCDSGRNIGYGFDTSYEADRAEHGGSGSVTYIKDYYGEQYSNLQADFVCCRHVLEHIPSPVDFLRNISIAIDRTKDSIVYFEFPNVLYSLDDMGIWDFIYEHCSYFCADSAIRAFKEAGYQTLEIRSDFGNQFLCLEASISKGEDALAVSAGSLDAMAQTVERFEKDYIQKLAFWNEFLNKAVINGDRVAIWGGGSKGVTFLNCIDNSKSVEFVIDLNPHKQGLFVAGTGHSITSPKVLLDNPVKYVIIMNSVYKQEIDSILREMDVNAMIVCA